MQLCCIGGSLLISPSCHSELLAYSDHIALAQNLVSSLVDIGDGRVEHPEVILSWSIWKPPSHPAARPAAEGSRLNRELSGLVIPYIPITPVPEGGAPQYLTVTVPPGAT